METVMFDCHGQHSPAYGCNKTGDQSGEYYRKEDVEVLVKANVALSEMVDSVKAEAEMWKGIADRINGKNKKGQ